QGPFALPDYYFEIKRQQVDAMANVGGVWGELQEEFAKLSGRRYRGFFEAYKLDDADYIYIVLGATAGTAKVAIDRLRRQRKRVGLLKLWLFRPFPAREIAQILKNRRAVAIFDRALSLGSWGPLYAEISAALNAISPRPVLYNYIYGLGGRDIRPEQLMGVLQDLESQADPQVQRFIGLRE
ncbi:MAG: pyruvate ferredoxin oxidoreductase, partial [Candidatus Bipolaricaulota bacterium]|nr:pyruvate ferredoxin oxidoreductase [Candidatus Bipolaricaulota bacterium]MDW8140827.1 pyruvate ferredoxin oxidoreductase [Candidatus Bipolaricaulota bacterium]